ncbi:hypothetical protein SLS60_008711 [Paraconiothyrium brasiliense]|uniref:Uncharacterized protein n=1 Tax=Paraconiothyrium brasiliense TaxID=300254 RepID=A0ABR3QY88_9PLEO
MHIISKGQDIGCRVKLAPRMRLEAIVPNDEWAIQQAHLKRLSIHWLDTVPAFAEKRSPGETVLDFMKRSERKASDPEVVAAIVKALYKISRFSMFRVYEGARETRFMKVMSPPLCDPETGNMITWLVLESESPGRVLVTRLSTRRRLYEEKMPR